MEVQETKRLGHYSNKQKILLVGEGDFSFALSLAKAFGTATKLTATSLDTQAELERNYRNGKSNVEELETFGCSVVYGVNVHSMTMKPSFAGSSIYDRVIFNFPHAGFGSGHEHGVKTILSNLLREVEFSPSQYPGYSNKRGSGDHSDSSFPVGKSATFIFTKQFYY